MIAAGAGGYAYYLKYQKDRPVEIQTTKASYRNMTEEVEANGRIQPVVQVKISPEVSGEIIELPFKEGQKVKKGDLLLKIKPDYYVASRRSAEASYKAALAGKAQAYATLEKAEIELKRSHSLFQDKLIPESSYQESLTSRNVAAAAYEAAMHQVDVANAALSRAEEDLAKTTIYSPISGTVSKLNSQLGERVVGTAMMTGTEVMVVADLTEMEARVEVGETDVVMMKMGLKAKLDVDAFRESKFNGYITEVANSSKNAMLPTTASGGGGSGQQDATRFEVRIRIQEKEAFLPGMSVTAKIETQYRTNVLAVPIECVTIRRLTNGVSKLDSTQDSSNTTADASKTDKKKDPAKPVEVVFVLNGDKVVPTPVKRGISDDTFVEILEGLKDQQEVVSGPVTAISRVLQENTKIKIASPNNPPRPSSNASP